MYYLFVLKARTPSRLIISFTVQYHESICYAIFIVTIIIIIVSIIITKPPIGLACCVLQLLYCELKLLKISAFFVHDGQQVILLFIGFVILLLALDK